MSSGPEFCEVHMLAWPWTALGLWGSAKGGLSAAARLGKLARFGAAGAAVAAASALAGAFLVPMRTQVTPQEIEVRFGRWTRFRIPLSEVERAYPRRYHPILEYGGWGIRFSSGGRAYSMRGDRGVQLVLRNGQRILIGSQRPEELAETICRRAGCVSDPHPPASRQA